ncbi:rRNA-processing protein EFG1 [Exaiptasia diaphana]|uniref:rRNA-processing protein EFG1 n=1 Tax=Exaiptasia diaphana TaxID=2652724 RepID=A0A913WX19_EXADI|nr:rRNA-processing protein EFG1 [Exaiptasia diaphana]KXJ27632.1 rRNA-processing protein EFG1 [Exaiptasia diaphana]
MPPIQQQRNRKNSKKNPETSSQVKKRKKSFKNQLRDVQRLLRQKDIPATVRVAQERMLNMLKENLTESAKQQKEKKMSKKYKMVKFFEKRKISRMYKSCTNELTQCKDKQQREELEDRLKLLKQQWNYITYFPKDEKYISLFPPTPCTNKATLDSQEEILKLINDKIAKDEIEDTSDMILHSPRDKKKMKGKSVGKEIRLSSQQDNQEQEDEPTSVQSPIDDFFIDTTPSKIVNSPTKNDQEQAESGPSESLSSDKFGATHKGLKRLKGEREIAAAKKNKKNKTKVKPYS